MGSFLAMVVLAASSFPLPALDGKAPAATGEQRTYRLPWRFERTRAFYESSFGPDSGRQGTLRLTGTPGQRVLTIEARDKHSPWTRAWVREKDGETVVEVAQVLTVDPTEITARGKPLVEFVFTRSVEVDHAVQGIDHTESMRAR